MKSFFKFTAIAAIAAAFVSCTEKPEPTPDTPDTPETPKVEISENLSFTLEVTEVATDQAKIKVEHDGTSDDTWFGFVTTETNVTVAIQNKVNELTADGSEIKVKKNKKTTVTERGLEPETAYTYIVFGLTAKGEVYGNVASVEFTTEAETPTPPTTEYKVNPAWNVTYIGDYEQGGKVYEHVVAVETTDSNPFFVTAWPVDYVEEYGIEKITEAEIEGWKEFFAQYPGQSFADVVYAESILSTVSIDLKYGTKWYAMAIGCDTEGNATGLYSLSDVIDFEGGNDDVELTEGYAAWLGNWTITGANGITQNVTFSKGTANKTFIMTGYEGPDAAGLDVTVKWMEDAGIWVIYNQMLGTYNFGQYGDGDVWFLGEGENEDIYLNDEIPVCIGGRLEDGSFAAYGYEEEYELEDGTPMTYKVVTMEYLAYLTDHDQLSYLTNTFKTGYPTFPMSFTKAETKAGSEFAVRKQSFGKLENTFSVKAIR